MQTADGAFEGASAAERDAALLRSQLEAWGTTALRRRLVADFGEATTDPEHVPRAEVMKRLLAAYAADGLHEGRRVVKVEGTPVSEGVRNALLTELQKWAYSKSSSGVGIHVPHRPLNDLIHTFACAWCVVHARVRGAWYVRVRTSHPENVADKNVCVCFHFHQSLHLCIKPWK